MNQLPDLPHYGRTSKRRWVRWVGITASLALVALGLWLFTRPTLSDRGCGPDCGDGETMANLRNALVAAKTFYTEDDTYIGFNVKRAAKIEPSLTFNSSDVAVAGEVGIREVTPSSVLLVTADARGRPWCVGDSALTGTSFGDVDARTAAECTGGW